MRRAITGPNAHGRVIASTGRVIPMMAAVSAHGDSPVRNVTFPAVPASMVLTVARPVRPVIQVSAS